MKKIQKLLYARLEEDQSGSSSLSLINRFLVIFILFSSTVAILETEVIIRNEFPQLLAYVELIVVTVFMVEYGLRFIAVGCDETYAGFTGRLKYIFSFWSVIDLLAIIPFFLTGLTDNTFLLRLLRLLRILRLAKLGRYSTAIMAITSAIKRKKYELSVSALVAFVVMLISSSFLYVFEGAAQPDAFGSITRSFWWSIATLTTVGYGDVTPITTIGRFFAGLTAIAGIGLIAMPTGILASAFSEVLNEDEEK